LAWANPSTPDRKPRRERGDGYPADEAAHEQASLAMDSADDRSKESSKSADQTHCDEESDAHSF
jgi:hypothetical protein